MHFMYGCPLAFGEIAVKDRVKAALNYKKPLFWVILLVFVLLITAGIFFFAKPKTKITEDIKDNNLEYESFIEGIKESYGMIGMEIEFIGNFDSINHFATILKIVREAATNALRHSKASKLTVKLDNNTIIISNNGSNPKEIKYGNGLNGMMFEAKEVGYSIDILNNPFRIIIHLTNNA